MGYICGAFKVTTKLNLLGTNKKAAGSQTLGIPSTRKQVKTYRNKAFEAPNDSTRDAGMLAKRASEPALVISRAAISGGDKLSPKLVLWPLFIEVSLSGRADRRRAFKLGTNIATRRARIWAYRLCFWKKLKVRQTVLPKVDLFETRVPAEHNISKPLRM